jgi:hypothetical protein
VRDSSTLPRPLFDLLSSEALFDINNEGKSLRETAQNSLAACPSHKRDTKSEWFSRHLASGRNR